MSQNFEHLPAPGSVIVLKELPPGLIDNLPDEDQKAITAIVGQPVVLNEYVEDGRAELEFKDKDGVIHFIYVNPIYIQKI
jgi:hypothetical protein